MEQDFNDKWEFYKDAEDKWRWRRTSPNGKIVGSSSEGYINKADCTGNASRNGWNGADSLEYRNILTQNEMNKETMETQSQAYNLQREYDKIDAGDLAARVESDRQLTQRTNTKQHNRVMGLLSVIAGLLFVIIAVLILTLFLRTPPSPQIASQPSIMVLSPNPSADEKVLVFSDTHFEFDQHALSNDAKSLLDINIQGLKDNPELNVRLAGYTSAKGTEEVNQELSELRANTVRDYLIEKGIAPERIAVIGYGRTRPALFEITPANSKSEEALANMRVLFEVVVNK